MKRRFDRARIPAPRDRFLPVQLGPSPRVCDVDDGRRLQQLDAAIAAFTRFQGTWAGAGGCRGVQACMNGRSDYALVFRSRLQRTRNTRSTRGASRCRSCSHASAGYLFSSRLLRSRSIRFAGASMPMRLATYRFAIESCFTSRARAGRAGGVSGRTPTLQQRAVDSYSALTTADSVPSLRWPTAPRHAQLRPYCALLGRIRTRTIVRGIPCFNKRFADSRTLRGAQTACCSGLVHARARGYKPRSTPASWPQHPTSVANPDRRDKQCGERGAATIAPPRVLVVRVTGSRLFVPLVTTRCVSLRRCRA